jgi:pimeloyl-ACP methyl ester carboxylesterase
MVKIPAGRAYLEGNLSIPRSAKGIIVFSHGSGSSRNSPRNILVAENLEKAGFGTLLFDLLTPDEEKLDSFTAELRFNIALLSERLEHATEFLANEPDSRNFSLGYFGASTGAAAALMASVKYKSIVKAIVSRGGRPDMADEILDRVVAPTLLIVGRYDTEVIELNRAALAKINAVKELDVVTNAGHLFEEPGALEKVAGLAVGWFNKYIQG